MTDPDSTGPAISSPAQPAPDPPAPSARSAPQNAADPQRNAFRRRATGNVGRGYSRLVNVMKVALPLLALGIMGLVVAWPTFVEQRSRKVAVSAASSDLVNPRYFSVDEEGQPFSVVAKLARESSTDTGIVNLSEPEAEMREKEGTWVTLKSRTGDYNRNSRILHMIGNVRILRDDGTEYTTDDAYADIAKGFAWGDGRIVGQGPQGEVDAEGFRLTDRGRTITFVNQTKANLPTPSSGKKDAPAAKAPAPRTEAAALPATPSLPLPPSQSPPPPATRFANPVANAPAATLSPQAAATAPAGTNRPAPTAEPAEKRAPPVTPSAIQPATAPSIAPATAPAAKPVWQPPLPRRKPAPPKSRN